MDQRKEIPAEMEALEKEIAALEEEIGVLASAIVTITSAEGPQFKDTDGEIAKESSCEHAMQLSAKAARIANIRQRVNDLHSRIEL